MKEVAMKKFLNEILYDAILNVCGSESSWCIFCEDDFGRGIADLDIEFTTEAEANVFLETQLKPFIKRVI